MGCYLAETIESTLVNLRPDDEYFIIDGGSTDNSVDIIRRYENRLTGWISEKDRGYADALAKGFARSSAKLQCWINCGDVLLPGALNEARIQLDVGGADMIFGDDLYIDESGHVLQVTNGHVDDLASMMAYGGWTPLQDACFWRRELYESVGGIDPEVRYAADYDLFLRMSMQGRAAYVPIIFSAFRRHDGQASKRHADAYQKEREACRHRELLRHDIQGWQARLKEGYYQWATHFRAHFQARKRTASDVLGTSVSELHCMPASDFGTGTA